MDYLSALLIHLKIFKALQGVAFNDICSLNHILFTVDIIIFIEDNDVTI